jgi:hypothetical protein
MGAAVDQMCDFEFTLWDDPTVGMGMQVGPTLTRGSVDVVQGSFSFNDLDFGDVFQNSARFLDIKVCCPTGCAPGYTQLSPRVKTIPTPYALALPGLSTEQNAVSPNIKGGHEQNEVTAGAAGANIGGGGGTFTGTDGKCALNDTNLCDEDTDCGAEGPCLADPSVGRCDDDNALCNADTPCATGICTPPVAPNMATANFASVHGGYGNQAGGDPTLRAPGSGSGSTVGGGVNNRASGSVSTVSGGSNNTASGGASTIGGGDRNTASGLGTTVGGGGGNSASVDWAVGSGGLGNAATGQRAIVPGGEANEASGAHSLAAGLRAKANHDGTFVWADNTVADFASTAARQFLIRATGGVGIGTNAPAHPLHMASGAHVTAGGVWTDASSRQQKENFVQVQGREVLEKVTTLPIATWNYKSKDDAVRHLGPVAEDFHAAFGTGADDKHLAALDSAGVALAAIQGLHLIVQEKDCRIDELEQKLASLEALVTKLAAQQNGGGR